mgnify:CR=1 FL=1
MNAFLSFFCYLFLKPIVKFIWIKEVRGVENIPTSNFILVSNHQSHFDQVTNAYICVPRKFTYLGQVDKYSGIQAILRNLIYSIGGVIPIHRHDEESKKRALRECIERLKRGYILVMYPEGTRSKDGKIQQGKSGVAKIYFESGVPILPVAVKGNFDIMPVGKIIPHFKRIVKINIGKPLEFREEMKIAQNLNTQSVEYKELCQKVINRVMEEIKRLFDEI